MSLKTVSIISLVIISLVFIGQLYELYSFLQIDSKYVYSIDLYIPVTIYEKVYKVIDTFLWLPFILFFWKIIKG